MKRKIAIYASLILLFSLFPAAYAWDDSAASTEEPIQLTEEPFYLTEEERLWIQSLGEITVMVDDHFAPLSFYESSTEEYSGASVDLFQQAAEQIGLSYTYVRRPELKWSQKLKQIQTHEIDVLFPVSDTADRRKGGLFSEPYYTMYYCAAGKSDNGEMIDRIEDLAHKRIGVVRDTSIAGYVETILNPEDIIYFDSDQSMYRAIEGDQVDYILQNENVFQEDYYKYELLDLVLKYRIVEAPQKYCYYFENTQEMARLIEILNRVIRSYDMGETIHHYETEQMELMGRYVRQKKNESIIGAVLAAAVVILFFVAVNLFRARRFSKRLEKEVAETQMAFLQSQIKPHFLYNALSAISAFCYTDGEKAGALIGSLSKYLRIVFHTSPGQELVSLRQEVELVQAYVDIETARYGDRFQVIFDIDRECLDYLTMPLLMQPLVENSIRHGVSKRREGGIVLLAVEEEEQMIHISVRDNGGGIPQEKIDELLRQKSGKIGVGLPNINQRLLHSTKAGLRIESVVGGGTLAEYRIPKRKEAGQC